MDYLNNTLAISCRDHNWTIKQYIRVWRPRPKNSTKHKKMDS